MPLTAEGLSRLTVPAIFNITKGSLSIPDHQQRRKENIICYILEHADAHLKGILEEAVKACTTNQPLKRKRNVTEFQTCKAKRGGDVEQDSHDSSKFLELPSESAVHHCYQDFHDATSDAALKTTICGICAREVNVMNNSLSMTQIQDLPTHRLHPPIPHPTHDLLNGRMLLEPEGVIMDPSGKKRVQVCGSCWTELNKDRTLPPKFSLANNLWIGRVPWELKKLTFPEQLLITHIYPRVFIFKLYLKLATHGQQPATLQRGMRGTVSSYNLNVDAAAAMVEGKLMPRPLSVLSSVISITYIGIGKLPKNWLHSTFCVRREAVASALAWLKANNPKYYGDIAISADELKRLPNDGIPDKILSIVQQSDDVGISAAAAQEIH